MTDIASLHNDFFSLHHCHSGFKNESLYRHWRDRMELIAAHNPAMVSYYNLYTRQYEYLNAEYSRLLYDTLPQTDAARGYDDFYRLVHPDDVESLCHAEMEAFKTVSSQPAPTRHHFSLITLPRVRNGYGSYCRLLRRISCLMTGSGGNLWLLTITADKLENEVEDNRMTHILCNSGSGLLYSIRQGESWTPYNLPLTATEVTMVYLFGQKFTNREVADKLFLSIHTVATYRNRILRHFHTNDIEVVYKIVSALGGFHSIRIADILNYKKLQVTK